MMPNQLLGWVFVGFPDEDLRSLLRARTIHLWEDARSAGKEPGQPVLFLQAHERGADWVGSGVVKEVEERWKPLGVYVETRTVLTRSLALVASGLGRHLTDGTRPVDSYRSTASTVWENRALAARIGLPGYRSRTPFLEGERDFRVTLSDWNLLCQLQPSLKGLLPK